VFKIFLFFVATVLGINLIPFLCVFLAKHKSELYAFLEQCVANTKFPSVATDNFSSAEVVCAKSTDNLRC